MYAENQHFRRKLKIDFHSMDVDLTPNINKHKFVLILFEIWNVLIKRETKGLKQICVRSSSHHYIHQPAHAHIWIVFV